MVSAAITGKISGVITAEATKCTAGECHGNTRRNQQHCNNQTMPATML